MDHLRRIPPDTVAIPVHRGQLVHGFFQPGLRRGGDEFYGQTVIYFHIGAGEVGQADVVPVVGVVIIATAGNAGQRTV